ncbi:MAG: DUF1707 domain-containing protein [Micromonosporaceae bacterium]|nr:DUF1707 domain-containing protein [Micromonosporaceae bacterium]
MGDQPGPPEPGDSMTPVPPLASPPVRASDDERHRVVELLGEHAAAGRITLAELEERVGRAYATTSRAELAELTRDLPALTEQAQPATPRRKASRWLVAIMGGSTHRNMRRLTGRVNIISVMGSDDLDLREVEIEGGELEVNAISLMGGPTIYVPDTVEVELSGPAIMGGNDERGSGRRPRPGAPVIRVRSFALMGGVDVWRLPAETRGLSLKAARRSAKALERGID